MAGPRVRQSSIRKTVAWTTGPRQWVRRTPRAPVCLPWGRHLQVVHSGPHSRPAPSLLLAARHAVGAALDVLHGRPRHVEDDPTYRGKRVRREQLEAAELGGEEDGYGGSGGSGSESEADEGEAAAALAEVMGRRLQSSSGSEEEDTDELSVGGEGSEGSESDVEDDQPRISTDARLEREVARLTAQDEEHAARLLRADEEEIQRAKHAKNQTVRQLARGRGRGGAHVTDLLLSMSADLV